MLASGRLTFLDKPHKVTVANCDSLLGQPAHRIRAIIPKLIQQTHCSIAIGSFRFIWCGDLFDISSFILKNKQVLVSAVTIFVGVGFCCLVWETSYRSSSMIEVTVQLAMYTTGKTRRKPGGMSARSTLTVSLFLCK